MRILYISRSKLSHSVNAVYIKGLRANNVGVEELFVRRNEFLELAKYLFKNRSSFDLILVGYDSPVLVCAAKLLSKRKVVYNALCSVYERLIISRALAPRYSIKAVYFWLSDFLAVHSADLVMVETDAQRRYFNKLFKVSDNKLFRAWTGVDDEVFYKSEKNIDKFPVFTAVFRGRFLPEAGADMLVRAAKLLDNHELKIYLLGAGPELNKVEGLIKELKPKNLELISSFLPDEKLGTILRKSHLSLGQLAEHPRLKRTIPHKAYESLALGLPYLTAANKAVLELLIPDQTCLVCRPGDERSLAEAILWAKNNPDELDRIAENGFRLYDKNLRSGVLAKKLLDRLV